MPSEAGGSESADQSARRVLPWALLWRVVLAWAAVLAPVLYLYGPAFCGVTALVGMVPGFAGHLVGHKGPSNLASALLVIAVAVLAAFPGPATAWAFACFFILCAGFEARRYGGRAFVLALYGWCALALAPNLPPASDALPFVALGVVWGGVSAVLIGVSGMAATPPNSARLSISLALFLLAGLIISVGLTAAVDGSYGYWTVLLFVLRALAPSGKGLEKAMIYGLGAVGGSALALLVTLSVPQTEAKLFLAALMTLVGLRFLPHAGPWSAAGFTSAVLLALPLKVDTIVLRAEAVGLAVGLTVVLVLIIGFGWTFLWKVSGTAEDQKTT